MRRAYLGVVTQPVIPAIAEAFGAKDAHGVLVGDVSAGGPAVKAGIEKGDIIIGVNGEPVENPSQFRVRISMMPPQATVNLRILRDHAVRDIAVTLGEFPEKDQIAKLDKEHGAGGLEGVSVGELDAESRRELQLPASVHGVVVTEMDQVSPAQAAGLRPGDVIQEVNRQPVRNIADFDKAVENAPRGRLLLLVNRGGTTLYVAL